MKWLIAASLALAASPSSVSGWPGGARGAVVLTYDDAVPSQLDHAVPALDAAGLKGTFFLSNVRLADVDRWRAVAANGHELGNHTLNHPCLAGTFDMPPRQQLESHTVDSVLQEVTQQNVLLTALDGRSEHGFAVPCGQTVAGGKDYLEPLRQSELVTYSRTVSTDRPLVLVDGSTIDLMKMPGRGFASPQNANDLIRYAEQALSSGGLAVFVFHGVGGDYLQVTSDDHRRLVEWLAAHRQSVWTTTMRDAVAYIDRRNKGASGVDQ
jgi:peptidoglycan/xylan/chitin deacetylase (PgdA/CDA1 family)